MSDHKDMPHEIDFSKGVRGLQYVLPGSTVLMPVTIEKGVWEYFSKKPRSAALSCPNS